MAFMSLRICCSVRVTRATQLIYYPVQLLSDKTETLSTRRLDWFQSLNNFLSMWHTYSHGSILRQSHQSKTSYKYMTCHIDKKKCFKDWSQPIRRHKLPYVV